MTTITITLPRATVEQALEALEKVNWSAAQDWHEAFDDEISALRAALAQQAEPVEPVAWVRLEAWKSGKDWPDDCFTALPAEGLTPLCKCADTPLQRKPLTEGMLMGVYIDFDRAADPAWSKAEYLLHFARAVERAHGIGGQE